MSVVKLYVGCALTHASEEFKKNVEGLKNNFRMIPATVVLDFMGVIDGTPREVYQHDIIECVGNSDIMVAICDLPSIGLGWEMATQVNRKKPLLAFAHENAKVTRLILDPGVEEYKFYRYQKFDEIYTKLVSNLVDLDLRLS